MTNYKFQSPVTEPPPSELDNKTLIHPQRPHWGAVVEETVLKLKPTYPNTDTAAVTPAIASVLVKSIQSYYI